MSILVTVSNDVVQPVRKRVIFLGASKSELRMLPKKVKRVFGKAIDAAQTGKKHPDAKPLKGFGGAGVLEVVEYQSGSTYRAVYTINYTDIVYVLSVFQKKSKTGRKTPKEEIDKIKARYKDAGVLNAKDVEQKKGNESR